jgi:hypothetical protein
MGRRQRLDATSKCLLERLHRIRIGSCPSADRYDQSERILYAMVEFARQKVLTVFGGFAPRKIDHGDDGAADPVTSNPQGRGADQILHLRRLRCGRLDPSQRRAGDHHRNHVVCLQDSSGIVEQDAE